MRRETHTDLSLAYSFVRVVCRGATWNEILHPDPILSQHPSWALPQLQMRMPAMQRIDAPATALEWKPFVAPGVVVQPQGSTAL